MTHAASSSHWRAGSRVGLERDRGGELSHLLVIVPGYGRDFDREIERAIESLPAGALTSAHVTVPNTVWKATENARAGLAMRLERRGVRDIAFEKATDRVVG